MSRQVFCHLVLQTSFLDRSNDYTQEMDSFQKRAVSVLSKFIYLSSKKMATVKINFILLLIANSKTHQVALYLIQTFKPLLLIVKLISL